MKHPLMRIEPYRHSATSRFVVEGLRINGKRVRKFFKTKKAATKFVNETKVKLANEGLSALTIGDNLRIMAQIDMLDNLVLGSTPEGQYSTPSSTSGSGYQAATHSGTGPVVTFSVASLVAGPEV